MFRMAFALHFITAGIHEVLAARNFFFEVRNQLIFCDVYTHPVVFSCRLV